MALLLRSVARSVGVIPAPALRRASGPLASPSSASYRPLAYHSRHQAGYYSNGGASQKQRSEIMEEIMAIKRAKKIERWYMGCFALGVGIGFYSWLAVTREVKAILREEAAAREEARVKGTWV